jgi:hypothetical protein
MGRGRGLGGSIEHFQAKCARFAVENAINIKG